MSVNRSSRLISMLFCLVAISAAARAGLNVFQDVPTSPQLWQKTETSPGSNVWIVELSSSGVSTGFRIEDTGNSGSVVKELHITRPPGGNVLTVAIGDSSNPSKNPDKVHWIGTSNANAGFVGVNANIKVELGGGSAPYNGVEHVNRFTAIVGGDVTAPINCIMHRLSNPKTSSAYSSNILLTGVAGDLEADVTMRPYLGTETVRGVINNLDFSSGNIGSESERVNILADGLIEQVFGKTIHANIKGTNAVPSNRDFDSFVYLIGLVQTNPLNLSCTDCGIFTGEIRADKLGEDPDFFIQLATGALRFAGEMRGRIWLQSFDMSQAPNEIEMPADKLKSTIALSVIDPGTPAANVWDGPIEVGAVTLAQDDANDYTPDRTAASLGGGAVGLVPFTLHREDSFPVKLVGGVVINEITDMGARPSETSPIKMRHYGPVIWDSADGDPFKIERRRNGSTSSGDWIDHTSCFTQTLDANTTVVLLTPNVQEPYTSLQRGYEYRVSRKTTGGSNVLRCDLPHLTTSADPEVADYDPLTFNICDSAALGDADDNGCVTFFDVIEVLRVFGQTSCLNGGDADCDGTVDFADVISVLANNTNTYCATCSQSFAAPSGRGPAQTQGFEDDENVGAASVTISQALASLGYSSIEQFVSAISAMSEEDRNAAINQLGELLE